MKVTVTGKTAEVTERETLTIGSVGIIINLSFSEEWALFASITAQFYNGGKPLEAPVFGDSVELPFEMAQEKKPVSIVLIGKNEDGTKVYPTVETSLGNLWYGIREGAEKPQKPSLDWQAQIEGAVNTANKNASKSLETAKSVEERANSGEFKGEKGDTGPQGVPGKQGERGPVGETGPRGEKGEQGLKGDTGAVGPEGETGPIGPQGERGPQGMPGADGKDGAPGERGPIGETGPQGEQGLPGKDGVAPDDSTVAKETPWSSEKTRNAIVETLCRPFEVSGPVVQCTPVGLDYPIHVVSHIVPKQEGSGDPSPENVRPFVATDKVELTRCGSNVLDLAPTTIRLNGNAKFQKTETGINVSTSDVGKGIYFDVPKKPNVPLYASYDVISNIDQKNVEIKFQNGPSARFNLTSGVKKHNFVSIGANVSSKSTFVIYSGIASGEKILEVSNLTIFYGNTDPGYESYTGSTYAVQLPPDVYGGEVDWEKKTLKTDLFYAEFDKFSYALSAGSKARGFRIYSKKTNQNTRAYCDKLKWVPTNFQKDEPYTFAHGQGPNGNEVEIMLPASFDLDAANQWLKDNKCIFAMPFSTNEVNITTSGTPTALSGVNTLYSDTGDTTVSGREDPVYNARIKEERITALENLITEKLGGM